MKSLSLFTKGFELCGGPLPLVEVRRFKQGQIPLAKWEASEL